MNHRGLEENFPTFIPLHTFPYGSLSLSYLCPNVLLVGAVAREGLRFFKVLRRKNTLPLSSKAPAKWPDRIISSERKGPIGECVERNSILERISKTPWMDEG